MLTSDDHNHLPATSLLLCAGGDSSGAVYRLPELRESRRFQAGCALAGREVTTWRSTQLPGDVNVLKSNFPSQFAIPLLRTR